MTETYILFGIIIILIFIIIFLIKNKNINTIAGFKKGTNLEEDAEKILKNLNMKNLKGPVKTSKMITHKTFSKAIYKNGEKISEETSNTESEIHSEAFTNCPNCGAKIESPNITNCPYCNTILINMNITTKKDS